MKTAGISFLTVLCVLTGSVLADPPTTAPSPRRLLAEGTDARFWIALVGPGHIGTSKSVETRLLSSVSFDTPWNPMPTIDGAAVCLASNSGELLVVLDDGSWMIADEDDLRPGIPPPHQERVLAMANEGDILWALVNGPEISATQPATLPTTQPLAATHPTTAPAPPRVILYRIDQGRWINPQNLPLDVPRDASALTMAIVEQTPLIAWRGADGAIQFLRLTRGGEWSRPTPVNAGDPQQFKLLRLHDQPALWIYPTPNSPTTQPSTGELLMADDFSQVVPLRTSTGFPPAGAPQNIAVAYGYLRWLASVNDAPVSQAFNFDGRATGGVRAVGSTEPPPLKILPYVGMGAVVVLLALVSALRQRRLEPDAPPIGPKGELRLGLAPLGTRVAAGTIDALPILAALSIVQRNIGDTLPVTLDQASMQLLSIGLLTYLAHTLISELICAQSIGKMLLGLRVVTTEGRSPTPMSIILRNLLRFLDLLVVPLLPVLITPLHQRIGDLFGGTVVISKDPADVTDDED